MALARLKMLMSALPVAKEKDFVVALMREIEEMSV